MKIAILGGTYNPVHIGHIFLAKEVEHFLKVDKVILVPTHTPSHKVIWDDIGINDRINMLKLATENEKNILIDECDIVNGGVSYTVDTISCIKKRYKDSHIHLVIGDDLFENFGTWKNPEAILRDIDLVVVHRIYQHKLNSPYKHTYINNKILPISSSEIRERIKKGYPVDYLVLNNVLKYILNNKLYLK